MKNKLAFLIIVISTYCNSQVVLSTTQILNIAAKQRMLTQKMVKAKVCLTLNIDNDNAVKELNASMILFQENLKLLKNYKASIELKSNITRIEQLWQAFATNLNTYDINSLKKVFDGNNYLLNSCDDLVTELRVFINLEAQKKLERENETRKIIEISGSLRYLSQRLSYLSLCELSNSLGLDVDIDLSETNLKFIETTNELLKFELNTIEIKTQISQVVKDFNKIKEIKKSKKADAKMLVDQCNLVLASSDILTSLYLELLK